MSLWSRFVNVFRAERLSREIDEELASHLAEAREEGREAQEVQRALGPLLRLREASRDIRLLPWLDSLWADAVFGWRQLRKRKTTAAAAILSLGLAFGACLAAFSLIDALLLRPLPVRDAGRLHVLSYQGVGPRGIPQNRDACEYPMFQRMQAAVRGEAGLLAISYAGPRDLTYESDEDMEKAYLQYVSGSMFSAFGIQPAAGRLLTDGDDRTPGAHPYAVLSYDYWTRRFARDPKVVGRRFRLGGTLGFSSTGELYTIVGVAGKGFTGVEPGTVTDVFVPTMMNPLVEEANASWFRTFVQLRPGAVVEPVREKLQAEFRAFREEGAKAFVGLSPQAVANFLNQRVLLEPAAAGISAIQKDFRKPLVTLGVLVLLVLLIACANVANLMTAQAAARSREMALRVSIGAGRARLVQLVLMEGAILGLLAAAVGAVFAWWSAPFVVSRILYRNNPVRLALSADWHVAGFGLAMILGVMLVFCLAPALRASAVKPVAALKGADERHSRGRLMHVLVAVQTAFCFLVVFAGGLFVATFARLSGESTGFTAKQLLALEVLPLRQESPEVWNQVVEHLRQVPGVADAALTSWAPLSGVASVIRVSVNGGPPGIDPVYLLNVAPGWLRVMRIPLIAGRDFRLDEAAPLFGIVNEAFAKQYFDGANPVGRSFRYGNRTSSVRIVGLVRNARYDEMRGPMPPVAYLPIRYVDSESGVQPKGATVMVRTAMADPMDLAVTLRKEVARARPGFRVSNIRTEEELVEAQTVRERLLALLGVFFAAVALLLAGIGLYGVLDYSVLQQRREIGIRMAIGAQAGDVAWRVALDALAMVMAGALTGLGLGIVLARFVQVLMYGVRPTDAGMIAAPWLVIVPVAMAATVPAVLRAVRTDPLSSLRAE